MARFDAQSDVNLASQAPPPPTIAVVALVPSALPAATALAAQLALPQLPELSTAPDYLLAFTGERLELRQLGHAAPGPIWVDFAAGRAAHRRQFGGGRHQALARAVGIKRGSVPNVIDATAGFGQDAFILAHLGCTVRMVERSPIIAALLEDGIQRAILDPQIGSWVGERLILYRGDARDYLRGLTKAQRPHTIYLDPMYPQRRKTALTSKEMRLLRSLVGEQDNGAELLNIALSCTQRRVVVKRPRLAPPLSGISPSAQIITPHTRFDLYAVAAPSNPTPMP